MKPRVISINTSKKRGTMKLPVEKAEFRIDHGIVSDAHAGPGIRQVSLMAKESVENFQKDRPQVKIKLRNGIFGENMTTEGVVLHKLKVGQRLKIQEVVLEVSKIGKECPTQCFIGRYIGDCIFPREGIFAIVVKEGEMTPESEMEIEECEGGKSVEDPQHVCTDCDCDKLVQIKLKKI